MVLLKHAVWGGTSTLIAGASAHTGSPHSIHFAGAKRCIPPQRRFWTACDNTRCDAPGAKGLDESTDLGSFAQIPSHLTLRVGLVSTSRTLCLYGMLWMTPSPPLRPFPLVFYPCCYVRSLPLQSSAMRARIVPPYPSFTYVMSQIGDSPGESQAGSWGHGDTPSKPMPRPYSKYDDNPFMVRLNFLTSIRGAG